MFLFIFKRALVGIAVILTVSFGVFFMSNVVVDPAAALAGEGASVQDIESVRTRYGLDRPLMVRYGEWLSNAVRGDLGQSYRQNRSVVDMVFERLPVTVALASLALFISLSVSILLAVLAALRPGSWVDILINSLVYAGQSLPIFWLGLMGIIIFSVQLRWLPVSGSTTFSHYILPSAAIAIYSMPTLLRLTRNGLIEVLESDYIRTARAKGMGTPTVVFRHALPNAIIPVVSIATVQFSYMLAGSVAIESVFAMHGVGLLAWEAVMFADLPVSQAVVIISSFIFVMLGLLSDLINVWLDPRLRIL